MENPEAVAVFYGIQDLKEDPLGKLILTHVLVALRDVVEQVSLRAVFQNNVNAVWIVDNLQHRDHVGVR